MSNEPYNLLRERWIPVALDNGQRAFVRPCDISELHEGHTILRIATGRPDCDISLTEFLIGLLAVTMGPEDDRDWLKRYRNPPTRQELEIGFAPASHAMNLDGAGARFFQDLEELDADVWQVEELFIDTTAEHFVKPGTTGRLSRAGSAIALLTLQTSAPEGGRGHLTSVRGGGPVSTIICPGSRENECVKMWQRLWANVPSGYRINDGPLTSVFPWLVPTRRHDQQVKTTPLDVHISQCFFGLPRRIRLIFEEGLSPIVCDLTGEVDKVSLKCFAARPGGTKYAVWGRIHPLSPYRKKKASDPEYSANHISSSRVGYREWIGLVVSDAERLNLPAVSVFQFYRRAADMEKAERDQARLLTSAYVMKQNKPLDFGEALMPLIVTGDPDSDDRVRAFAEGFVKAADLIANQLGNAVKRALFGEKAKTDRDTTVLDAVRQRFWGDTEQAFYAALRHSAELLVTNKEDAGERLDELRQAGAAPWLAVMRNTALAIFDDTAPIDDAESSSIKDVIEGRRMLVLALTGYGPVGAPVFAALSLPAVETKAKKGRKAA